MLKHMGKNVDHLMVAFKNHLDFSSTTSLCTIFYGFDICFKGRLEDSLGFEVA